MTGAQQAAAISEAVKKVQRNLAAVLDQSFVIDGKYSTKVHEAFRAVLAQWLGPGADDVAKFDDQGPMLYAAYFEDLPLYHGNISSVSSAEAEMFAAAWLWWASKRLQTIPAGVASTMTIYLQQQAAAGNDPLAEADVASFISAVPGSGGGLSGKAIWIAAAAVAVVAVVVVVVASARKSRRVPVYAGWR